MEMGSDVSMIPKRKRAVPRNSHAHTVIMRECPWASIIQKRLLLLLKEFNNIIIYLIDISKIKTIIFLLIKLVQKYCKE